MAGDLALCNCLVVDQNMPGLSGLDLITLLRAGHFAGPAILMEPPQLSVRERAEKAGIPIVEKPLLGNARPTSLQRKRSTARPGPCIGTAAMFAMSRGPEGAVAVSQ
jgi:hypothetical protein